MENVELGLLECVSDALLAVSSDWLITYINHQAAEILGCAPEDVLGKNLWTEFPRGIGGPFHQAYHQAMAEQVSLQMEQYSPILNRWFENRVHPSPRGLCIFFHDVTERKQTEQRLHATALRLETLIANLQAGIVVEDDGGQIVLTNQTFCDLLGLEAPPHALVGRSLSFVARQARQRLGDPRPFLARLNALRRRPAPAPPAEITLRDGRMLEVECIPVFPGGSVPNAGEGAGYGGHLWQFRDVTQRKQAERQIKDTAVVLKARTAELERANADLQQANIELEALATTDALTGLKNHRIFVERLREEWHRAKRYAEPLSLIMLDVEHFKTYNDSFGHPAGNRALRLVADILRETVRETDIAARYGGEEMAIILPHTGAPETAALAERLRGAIEAAPWERRPVTVSLGVCALTEAMTESRELVRGADIALYRAKSEGRNRVAVFSG